MSRSAGEIVVAEHRDPPEAGVRWRVVGINRKRLLRRLPGASIALLAGQQAYAHLGVEVRGQPVPRRGVARIDFEYLPQKRVGLRKRLEIQLSPKFPGL